MAPPCSHPGPPCHPHGQQAGLPSNGHDPALLQGLAQVLGPRPRHPCGAHHWPAHPCGPVLAHEGQRCACAGAALQGALWLPLPQLQAIEDVVGGRVGVPDRVHGCAGGLPLQVGRVLRHAAHVPAVCHQRGGTGHVQALQHPKAARGALRQHWVPVPDGHGWHVDVCHRQARLLPDTHPGRHRCPGDDPGHRLCAVGPLCRLPGLQEQRPGPAWQDDVDAVGQALLQAGLYEQPGQRRSQAATRVHPPGLGHLAGVTAPDHVWCHYGLCLHAQQAGQQAQPLAVQLRPTLQERVRHGCHHNPQKANGRRLEGGQSGGQSAARVWSWGRGQGTS